MTIAQPQSKIYEIVRDKDNNIVKLVLYWDGENITIDKKVMIYKEIKDNATT